jgi:hypothetical protein
MKAALETILPDGWGFTAFEPLQDLPDVTSLTMKVSEIRRHPAAPLSNYQVDWVLTITTSYTSRETADPQLFDDLINFLFALDNTRELSWLAWSEAKKVVGDDLERLAYDITIQMIHDKPKAEEAG